MRTEPHRWGMPLAVGAAVVVGAALAVQSRMNGSYAEAVGIWLPTWTSFGSGWILLCALWAVPGYRRRVLRAFDALRVGRLRWWQVLGGVNGGLFVLVQSTSVPQVGVAAFLIATVGGQGLSALFVDRWGLGSAPPQALTAGRVAAALLAIAGVALAVTGQGEQARFVLLPVLAAVAVGMGLAFQQAFNGRVTTVTGDGVATAWVNFTVGLTTVLLLGAVPMALTGFPPARAFADVPAWAWWGGLVGVLVIALSAWAVQHSGVLAFGLVSITSQMSLALLLDVLNPDASTRVTGQVLVGIVVTVVAAGLAAVAAQRARRRLLD